MRIHHSNPLKICFKVVIESRSMNTEPYIAHSTHERIYFLALFTYLTETTLNRTNNWARNECRRRRYLHVKGTSDSLKLHLFESRGRGLIEFAIKEPPFLKVLSSQVQPDTANCGSALFYFLIGLMKLPEFRTNNLCSGPLAPRCDYRLANPIRLQSNSGRFDRVDGELRLFSL